MISRKILTIQLFKKSHTVYRSLLHCTVFSSSKYGIYEPNCGLDNVMMSWGHDEYLYRVLVNHGATIPEEGLAMIKYHSFYPWHTGGDYEYLTNEKDAKMMEWVREFK